LPSADLPSRLPSRLPPTFLRAFHRLRRYGSGLSGAASVIASEIYPLSVRFIALDCA